MRILTNSLLWDHKPLTDFRQIGPGKARRLYKACMMTMGDVAERSLWDEEWFYKQFGIDGEILIDHAWGIEPVSMQDKVVFHSLCHSSITYKLKLNGGDVKAVQGDSGHSQTSMVTDVYSHSRIDLVDGCGIVQQMWPSAFILIAMEACIFMVTFGDGLIDGLLQIAQESLGIFMRS